MSIVPGFGLIVGRVAQRLERHGPDRDPRVVLVTGASSGIGRAVALEAAAAGGHVVLAARGDRSLEEVREECTERGALSALAVPTDVGDDDQVAALVERALDRHGRID